MENTTSLSKNNKGFTLVELIISILILMVIFLPAITGFNSAIKASQRSQDISFAENAASAVLEEVKYYGIQQVMEKGNHNEGNWKVNTDDPLHPYYVYSDDGTGIYTEGNEDYEVRVYFEDGDYSTNANNYHYADLSNFASSESVVLNPGVMGDNYDQIALEFFIQQYDHYAEEVDAARWQAYTADYNAIIEWNEDHDETDPEYPKPLPDRPPDIEVPSKRLAGVQLANFQDCIIKSANVILSPQKLDNGDGTYTYQMRLTSRMVYIFSNEKADEHPDDPGYIVNDFHFHCNTTERVFSGFCENAVYVNVKSVYILYTPISDDLSCDQVTIINGNDDPDEITTVYIVIQSSEDKVYNDETDAITIDIPSHDSNGGPLLDGEGNPIENHNNNLRVCCQAQMKYKELRPLATTEPDTNGREFMDRLLEDEKNAYDRISGVSVRVLPAGCTAAAGSTEEKEQELARVDSTVLQ